MTIGFALCGSFCTYDRVFPVMERLGKSYELIPIFSQSAYSTNSRFGNAEAHIARAEAICGRPVSRCLDDGLTLEIYRNCTDGTRNACSKLYGACVRVGASMGYHKIITYTLESEPGTSLRASGFTCDGPAGGIGWTGSRRRDYYIAPQERKTRWRKTVK